MVTLGSFITFTIILLVITIIDTILYDVSFLGAMQLMFVFHISVGRLYLLFAAIFALVSAIIVDFRRKKTH
ncbi:MAG: hypothetical protein ACK4M9_00770 [Anaerobacillus sp.]|uniref:hypothetical protein n=1 Tax=Anaerobacillus sp. TaxID=1872506 RepID=UPI003919A6DA